MKTSLLEYVLSEDYDFALCLWHSGERLLDPFQIDRRPESRILKLDLNLIIAPNKNN